MKFFKRMFHHDLSIRYERKIRKGTLRVKKRDTTNKWAYVRWHLTSVWHEFKYARPILIILVSLFIWTYTFQFILDNYADSCALSLFNLKISVKISYWLGNILPLFLYLVATSIAAVSMIKHKLNTMGEWQLDLRRSNKSYIVERRRSTKFIKLQRILFGVILGLMIISCLNLTWIFGKAGYRTLSEYDYSISDLNKVLIDECKQEKLLN